MRLKNKNYPKYFWSFAKRKSKLSNNIGLLKNKPKNLANDFKEIREILSKKFKSVFTNKKTNKRKENSHAFFEAESLQSTKIRDISFTGKTEKVLANRNLNEPEAAWQDT